jgi:hypothetical protein
MNDPAASAGLSSLSLWIESRLGTRQASLWVTKAFKGEKGLSHDELRKLVGALADRANQQADLPAEIRTIWRLFDRAARDRESRPGFHHAEQFKRRIREGKFSTEDVSVLIEFVRPRLAPSEPSRYEMAEDGFANDPARWVIWQFDTRSGSVDQGIGKIDSKLLSTLPSATLAQILKEGTNSLVTALEIAREAGWMRDGRDFANRLVARVAFDPKESVLNAHDGDEEDHESRDPDAYHDDFAPLLRLITSAFDALAGKDANSARRIVNLWELDAGGLFARLQAHAGLNPAVWDGHQVGQFLQRLSDIYFWRWSAFPEVASLRALRWREIPIEWRNQLVERLITGPASAELDPDSEMSPETLRYWRDYEVARVVDNNQDVPKHLFEIVEARRAGDKDFPVRVSARELGTPSVRFSRVPDGDPNVFGNVADEDLISTLVRAADGRLIGEGDNAQAYTRRNRRRVIEALAQRKDAGRDTVTVWEFALAYPHEKPDNIEDARQTAELISKFALEMEIDLFERLSERLCYWLDATDEQLKNFSFAVPLWERLLPFAVARENIAEATPPDGDLSIAALNVPFGHLVSFFFRRCPTIPAQGEKPPLPQPFVGHLKQLQGRARTLLANRMIAPINYFWRADPDWLKTLVLDPMLSQSAEGGFLWEAFAKFGPVPSPTLWGCLEEHLIKQVAMGRLSKDALRRLAEMLVVVWSWIKTGDRRYLLGVGAVRSALSISSSDVRGAAAWQFVQLIKEEDSAAGENPSEPDLRAQEEVVASSRWADLGPSFFSEVWPLEPAVQDPQSANDFARLPGRVGERYYSEAIRTIISFLRPFEVWDVDTAFDLPKEKNDLVIAHPTETLALIAACVPDDQKHSIYGLGRILSLIKEAKPQLHGDPEFRRLQRFVLTNDPVDG